VCVCVCVCVCVSLLTLPVVEVQTCWLLTVIGIYASNVVHGSGFHIKLCMLLVDVLIL
jgi:hypothetical protein